jgi:hypothetical protein
VCDINDAGGGIDGEYRTLHRANEIILRAEVSQESDDRGFQVSSFEFRVSSKVTKHPNQISGLES